MKKENTARVLMALAMLIFGTLAPFVRLCGASSGELALYRAFMAMFIVGGFLLFTRQKISFSKIKKDLFLLQNNLKMKEIFKSKYEDMKRKIGLSR